MVILRHHAKFHGDQSNHCGDMAIFQFFQDGVSGRHLEVLGRLFRVHLITLEGV